MCKVSNLHRTGRRDPHSRGRDGDHLTAQQEFCCPRAGTQLSVNKDFSLSASICCVMRSWSWGRLVLQSEISAVTGMDGF